MRILSMILSAALAYTLPISAASAQDPSSKTDASENPQVDYAGFLQLTGEVARHRQARLINLQTFNRISSTGNAIILDTRSAAAFRQGHIEGAINLPFSDFTAKKLAHYLGDQNRPILIYCNNNFREDIVPVARKAAPLALNIPTFINLYGYGYKNIYELSEIIQMTDPRIRWVSNTL